MFGTLPICSEKWPSPTAVVENRLPKRSPHGNSVARFVPTSEFRRHLVERRRAGGAAAGGGPFLVAYVAPRGVRGVEWSELAKTMASLAKAIPVAVKANGVRSRC